ncbi:MAG TPA: hypothetical protein VGH28_33655 [Polyangiaceae bacterium]|jgi:hypothetical protein
MNVKRVMFVVVVCACSKTTPSVVEIATPDPSASAIASAKAAMAPPARPANEARIVAAANGSWAAKFPRASSFATYDVPGSHVVLAWRIGAHHARDPLVGGPGYEDAPANHVARVELVVSAGSVANTIAFGDLSGTVDPLGLSWCERTGFHLPADAGWAPPPRNPAVASTFSIGITQGSDELMVVRDAGKLHVLHRETSDGRCVEAKQGPLDVCAGDEWQLVADVRVAPDAELWESVTEEGRAFACGAARPGETLIKP